MDTSLLLYARCYVSLNISWTKPTGCYSTGLFRNSNGTSYWLTSSSPGSHIWCTKYDILVSVFCGCVQYRKFCNSLSFFLLLLLVSVSGMSGKSFLGTLHRLLLRMCVTRIALISLTTLENVCVEQVLLIWNFMCDGLTCHML